MLFIVNGRGVSASKYLLSARLPTKRLASLTSAIKRGARNASEISERIKPSYPRPTRESPGGERHSYGRFRSSEQQDRRPPVEYRHSQQRREGTDGQTRSRYPSKDNSWTRGRDSREQLSPTKGDRTSFSSRTVKSDRFLGAGERDRTGSRYPKRYAENSPRTQSPVQRHSSGGEGRGSLARELSTHRSSSNGGDETLSEPRYPDRYDHKNGRSQRPAKASSASGEDGGAFKRKPTWQERSQPADQQEQDEAGKSESNTHKVERDRWPSERMSGRKPDEWQGFRRQDKQEPRPQNERGSGAATRHVRVPLAIPRSAAASEFIYGTSAVKAALQAGTRKLYKLYIYQGASEEEQRGSGDKVYFRLAYKRNLEVKRVDDEGLPLLEKMAQGRPHNGVVLEASQLPNTPASALEMVDKPGNGFSFTAGHQSAEDLAVNGASNEISGSSSRYPFVLLLDSIQDPGNLGSIIRSAAFFGVDAIVLIDNFLAPFSPVTIKASSGAAEYMRYLKVKNDHDFIRKSQSNGWTFYAAVAPASASAERKKGPKFAGLKEAENALMKGPCVLMLGGEGEGLRPRLQAAADCMVGMEGVGGLKSRFGLDSLNVSVAAALMMQIFNHGSQKHADDDVSAPVTDSTKEDNRLF